MKNRPVAAQPNQFKDVYGSQKSSTRATITVLLLIVMTVLTIIAWVNRSYVLLALFAPTLVGLIISLFVGRHADRVNSPVEPKDSPEAIFKEHEE